MVNLRYATVSCCVSALAWGCSVDPEKSYGDVRSRNSSVLSRGVPEKANAPLMPHDFPSEFAGEWRGNGVHRVAGHPELGSLFTAVVNGVPILGGRWIAIEIRLSGGWPPTGAPVERYLAILGPWGISRGRVAVSITPMGFIHSSPLVTGSTEDEQLIVSSVLPLGWRSGGLVSLQGKSGDTISLIVQETVVRGDVVSVLDVNLKRHALKGRIMELDSVTSPRGGDLAEHRSVSELQVSGFLNSPRRGRRSVVGFAQKEALLVDAFVIAERIRVGATVALDRVTGVGLGENGGLRGFQINSAGGYYYYKGDSSADGSMRFVEVPELHMIVGSGAWITSLVMHERGEEAMSTIWRRFDVNGQLFGEERLTYSKVAK